MKNEALTQSLIELLTTNGSTKADIAQLLVQNGVEISDEDLAQISVGSKANDEEFQEVPYELSPDGKSFAVESPGNKVNFKKVFVKVSDKSEARFLQDLYTNIQGMRIDIAGKVRAKVQGADNKSASEDANNQELTFLMWYLEQLVQLEDSTKKALEAFSDSYYISRWAKKVKGIGPVIATELAANLEIKDETFHAGNWWSYSGLNDNNRPWLGREKSKAIVEEAINNHGGVIDDYTVYEIAAKSKWKYSWLESKAKDPKKGWKKDLLIKACSFIPYNKNLKVLMYKIGHSFRLCKNKKDSLYGRILKEREEYENTKNANLDYKDQAEQILKSKNIGKGTVAYSYYSKGMLPPAHISQRAERYATKLFISHLFEAAWWNKYGVKCPEPYIIGFDESGHNDYIGPEIPYDSIKRDEES